jgi:pimeloyl-ACP methyl ester carboxylesterase
VIRHGREAVRENTCWTENVFVRDLPSFDDVVLNFEDDGSGRGVVLLHGFLVDGDPYWRQGGIARSLSSTGYRVITPDARGHGVVQSSRHREVLGWCTCARFLGACGLLVAS